MINRSRSGGVSPVLALLFVITLSSVSAAAVADDIYVRYAWSEVDAECARDPNKQSACERNCHEAWLRESQACAENYFSNRSGFDFWDLSAMAGCLYGGVWVCPEVFGQKLFDWMNDAQLWDRAKQCTNEASLRQSMCASAEINCLSSICSLTESGTNSPPEEEHETYEDTIYDDVGGSRWECTRVYTTDQFGTKIGEEVTCRVR